MEILLSSEGSNTPGTLLSGSLPDQAPLFGISSQWHSPNLTLMEVRRTNPAVPTASASSWDGTRWHSLDALRYVDKVQPANARCAGLHGCVDHDPDQFQQNIQSLLSHLLHGSARKVKSWR